MYSNKASPQLKKMMEKIPAFFSQPISSNFKCPYQASVMKTLEITRNKIVNMALLMIYKFSSKIGKKQNPPQKFWNGFWKKTVKNLVQGFLQGDCFREKNIIL